MSGGALALVRGVPASFASATTLEGLEAPLDPRLAAVQHAEVVEGLRWLGARVEVLDADEAHPDCVFIEDTAVIVNRRALITRSGNPGRRGEVGPVEARLVELGLDVRRVEAPGTLDGGDVLVVDDRIYVGLSARTNAAGVAQLASWLGGAHQVETVDVPRDHLHLKCLCSAPDGRVVVAEGPLWERFARHRRVRVPAAEWSAANMVGRAGRVLVAAGFPTAAEAAAASGLEVRAVDTSELRRADGALTCLSLRLAFA